jgi:hypothetical protein
MLTDAETRGLIARQRGLCADNSLTVEVAGDPPKDLGRGIAEQVT